MPSDPEQMQPVVNPLPPVVMALALAIFGVEVLLSAGARGIFGGPEAIGWRSEAVQSFAFSADILAWIVERQAWLSPELTRFVTYPFVHFSFTHAVFVIVFVLALGKLVGEVLGSFAVLAVFFLSAIFGALVFAGLSPSQHALVGGYSSVYGLIGAYTFLLWTSYGISGDNQWRAFTLIGFLLGIQLVFGVLFGSRSDWIAEVAGFVFGFFVAPFVARGAFGRLLEKMRQR